MNKNVSKPQWFWPDAIEWVCFSLAPEKTLPLAPIRSFYHIVIDDLLSECKSQLYDLKVNKNPVRFHFVSLEESKEYLTKETFRDFVENYRDKRTADYKNIFFVMFIYDDKNEEAFKRYGTQIMESTCVGVVGFSTSFLHSFVGKIEMATRRRRDINLHRTTMEVLKDIVEVMVQRKEEMRLRGEYVPRAPSPTGASVFFSDSEEELNDMEDEQANAINEGVRMPHVGKRLSLRVAEQLNEQQTNSMQISSSSVETNNIQLMGKQLERVYASASKKLERPSMGASPVSTTKQSTTMNWNINSQTLQPLSRSRSMNNVAYEEQLVEPKSSASGFRMVQPYKPRQQPGLSAQQRFPTPPIEPSAALNLKTMIFQPLELKKGECYDVLVTCSDVSSPGAFYVQPFFYKNYLEMLAFRMALFYAILQDGDMQLPYEEVRSSTDLTSIWCAAPGEYGTTNDLGEPVYEYHRATLLRRVEPTLFEVFYVDYGNVSTVPFNRLKWLPASFRDVGGIAQKCKLIQPNIPAELILDKVDSIINCVMRIEDLREDKEDEPIVVSLFYIDETMSKEVDIGAGLSEIVAQVAPAQKQSRGRGNILKAPNTSY